METHHKDIDGMCRACKTSSEEMRSIFEVLAIPELPRIDEMLMTCTSVQVSSEDVLPKKICENCLEQLHQAFVFKKLCENSDASFRKVLDDSVKEEQLQCREILDSLLNNEESNGENAEATDAFTEDDRIIITCHECMQDFRSIEALKVHQKVHEKRRYQCKFCKKKYARKKHLIRHENTHKRHKVFVCKICSLVLKRMEHLRRHLLIHLVEKPHPCASCNRTFITLEHLQSHVPKCKGVTVFPCNICSKVFVREDSCAVHKSMHPNQNPVLLTMQDLDNIEDHYFINNFDADEVKEEDEKSIDDGDCIESIVKIKKPKVDKQEDSTKVEKRKEIEEDETCDKDDDEGNKDETSKEDAILQGDEEKCLENDLEFLAKRGRGRPKKTVTPVTPVPRYRKRSIKSTIKDNSDEFGCPTCNEILPNKAALAQHTVKAHEGSKAHKCKICDKVFSRTTQLKRHYSQHTASRKFKCSQCDKKFTRQTQLTHHEEMHNKVRFKCDLCSRNFSSEDGLSRHQYNQHSVGDKPPERKFLCTCCNKSFTTENFRNAHIKAFHTSDRTYRCTVCEKTFMTKSHLNEHLKFHEEHAKKFLCSECGQRFIRNDYLVIHMRRHRGEKPFKCRFCGKGFPRTTDLTVHERYHTGEKTHLCTICGRGFGRAYNLTVHMRTHTGEKPYHCGYCDASFAQGNDLKAHVRRHTGERFHCELCPQSFIMEYLLKNHKRIVHGINVVGNVRRLNHVNKTEESTEDLTNIEITLPQPVVSEHLFRTSHLILQDLQLPEEQLETTVVSFCE